MRRRSDESLEKEAILEGIRNIAVDGYASSTNHHTLAQRARRHFESWEIACKQAGVRPFRRKPKIYNTTGVLNEPKRDCKLYQDDMRCEGLNRMYCKFEDCNFYKPMDGGAEK